jgi:hypothetical protein
MHSKFILKSLKMMQQDRPQLGDMSAYWDAEKSDCCLKLCLLD